MTRKYEFTGETKNGLRQIRRISNGVVGGWIEKESNLSHENDAWVYGDAWVSTKIICATRSDGYTFLITPTKDKSLCVIAGCRYFTFMQAREHWTKTRGGTQLGDESLAILNHLEVMAKLVFTREKIDE